MEKVLRCEEEEDVTVRIPGNYPIQDRFNLLSLLKMILNPFLSHKAWNPDRIFGFGYLRNLNRLHDYQATQSKIIFVMSSSR